MSSARPRRLAGRDVARLVREEFRDDWAEYFKLKDTDADHFVLRDIHDGLVTSQEERQQALWETRRLDLREAREEDYRALLDAQKVERADLTARQERGGTRDHDIGLGAADEPQPFVARGVGDDSPLWHFRGAAAEVTRPAVAGAEPTGERGREEAVQEFEPAVLNPRVRDGSDVVASVGLGMMGGAATLVERLFDGFLDGGPTLPFPANDRGSPPEPPPNPFAGVAAEARRTAEREQEDAARDAWWDERRAKARD